MSPVLLTYGVPRRSLKKVQLTLWKRLSQNRLSLKNVSRRLVKRAHTAAVPIIKQRQKDRLMRDARFLRLATKLSLAAATMVCRLLKVKTLKVVRNLNVLRHCSVAVPINLHQPKARIMKDVQNQLPYRRQQQPKNQLLKK